MQSCFEGPFYPSGLDLLNRFKAYVDWQGTSPHQVDFDLNGATSTENASSWGAYHDYNMGHDLDYGLLWARNTLQVTARSTDGKTSPPYTYYLVGINPPSWIGSKPPVGFTPACQDGWGGVLRFGWQLQYPDPPFEGQVTPPSWFPFIGGQSFGVRETQAGLELEATSAGNGSAELSGQTGFDAAGKGVTGRIYGQGDVAIGEGEGLRLTGATLGLELSGEIEVTKPLPDVICKAFTGGTCPLKEAENLFIVGSLIRWFNKRAELKALIEPGLNVETSFSSTSSGWQWKGLTGGANVRLTLSLILNVIKKGLTAEAYGGGEPSVTFQVPPAPSYLKKLAAELFAGLKLKAWRFKKTFEASYTWSYSPSGTTALAATAPAGIRTLTVSGWQPIPRDYAADPTTYAVFRANEKPLHLAGDVTALRSLGPLGVQATEENRIASNVFPESHPAIGADGNVLLLWVHDDTSRPLMQGEEIYYSVYNGSTWSSPAGITGDNLQDFAPQVAYDGSGHAVA
ncbi:MAG: hypothetical protein D6819_09700, partial [Gammaproteobacteria bacterium]